MNTASHNRGFSLVELITAMSVATILMGSATPSFVNVAGSSRSASEYRDLLKGLQLARSEAITRGVNVTVSTTDGANWHKGFRIWADDNGDGLYSAGEDILVSDDYSSQATMIEASNTSAFSYTSEGFLNATSGSEFVLAYRTGQNCMWDRDIRVVYTGHVSAREATCKQ